MAFASSIRLPRLADVMPCQPCLLLQDGRSFDEAKTVRLVGALLRRVACPTCLVWCKSDSLVRGRLSLRHARAQLFSGAKDVPCGRHGPAVLGNLPALIRAVDSEVSRMQNADAPNCRWLPWRSSGQARSWGMLSSTRLRGTGRLAWTASYACRRQRCHSLFATIISPSMCMADGDTAPDRAARASQLLGFEQPTFLNKAAAQAKGCSLRLKGDCDAPRDGVADPDRRGAFRRQGGVRFHCEHAGDDARGAGRTGGCCGHGCAAAADAGMMHHGAQCDADECRGFRCQLWGQVWAAIQDVRTTLKHLPDSLIPLALHRSILRL